MKTALAETDLAVERLLPLAPKRRALGADKVALDGRVYGHRPILCEEVVEALAVDVEAPVLVDATFGRGGHSRRLLQVPGAQAAGRVKGGTTGGDRLGRGPHGGGGGEANGEADGAAAGTWGKLAR